MRTHHIKINSGNHAASTRVSPKISQKRSQDRRGVRIPKCKLLVKNIRKKSKRSKSKMKKMKIPDDSISSATPKSPVVVNTVKKFKSDFSKIKANFARKMPKSFAASPKPKRRIIVSGPQVSSKMVDEGIQVCEPKEMQTEEVVQVQTEVVEIPMKKIAMKESEKHLEASTPACSSPQHHDDVLERDSGNENVRSTKGSLKLETTNMDLKSSKKSEEDKETPEVSPPELVPTKTESPAKPLDLKPAPLPIRNSHDVRKSKSNIPPEDVKLNSTDRKDRDDEFNSEGSKALFATSSSKLLSKRLRKPSDHLLVTKGLLQDHQSNATVNQSSDIVTAHFHSTRQKSVTSRDSPIPEKDIEQSRAAHEDPITFLKRFDLLFT